MVFAAWLPLLSQMFVTASAFAYANVWLKAQLEWEKLIVDAIARRFVIGPLDHSFSKLANEGKRTVERSTADKTRAGCQIANYSFGTVVRRFGRTFSLLGERPG